MPIGLSGVDVSHDLVADPMGMRCERSKWGYSQETIEPIPGLRATPQGAYRHRPPVAFSAPQRPAKSNGDRRGVPLHGEFDIDECLVKIMSLRQRFEQVVVNASWRQFTDLLCVPDVLRVATGNRVAHAPPGIPPRPWFRRPILYSS